MIKRTFGSVKAELSRVAGQAGMQATDPRLKEMVFLAQERLCSMGEWPFQYARLRFRQYGGVVSLPCEYEALVHAAVDDQPVETMPPWFEYLDFGPGPQDRKTWTNAGLDLGESPVYRQPGSDGGTLRVVSTSGDDVGQVVVYGYDTDGVRQKVSFDLPESISDVQWSKITQVVKPVTSGDVVLSITDQFGEQAQAAVYRSRDTNPTFRTYRFPAVDCDESICVSGIVRRRLYPIVEDDDELLITNVGALRLGVKAIALEDKGQVGEGAACFSLAKTILLGESHLYKGSRQPAPVNVKRVANLSVRPDIY